MKFLIVATFLGIAAAQQYGQAYPEQSNRPQAAAERNARILVSEADVNENGFRYNFETENGIRAEEQGQERDGIETQGGFAYTGDDGQVYSISFSAGQGGYQPQGAHLPTPPPVPEEIQKALAQNAADEAAGIIDDGKYDPAKHGGGAAAPGPAYNNQYRAQASASAGFNKRQNRF